MAPPKAEKYRLLAEDNEEQYSDGFSEREAFERRDFAPRKFSHRFVAFGGCLLALSLFANAVLGTTIWWKPGHVTATAHCASPVAKLENTHPRTWKDHTIYSQPNTTEADRAWINMDIDYIVVALDKEEASEQGLPPSADFPWDPTHGAYMITTMHSLHCLKSLHRSNLEYRNGVKQSYPTEHLIHCLDNVRQDLICSADDTPRFIPVDAKDSAHTGIGQWRQCKDFSKLEQWSRAHSACFSYNELITHELKEERGYPHALQFCPKDSKWLPAVRKFYGKPDDWVPEKPPPPYPAVGVPFDGYENQRNAAAM